MKHLLLVTFIIGCQGPIEQLKDPAGIKDALICGWSAKKTFTIPGDNSTCWQVIPDSETAISNIGADSCDVIQGVQVWRGAETVQLWSKTGTTGHAIIQASQIDCK